MSVLLIPPYTPLLYSKTGVYRAIRYFSLFLLYNIDCEAVLTCTHIQCFERGRTGLMVRASDSGSGDPGSILGRVGVFVSLSKRHLLPKKYWYNPGIGGSVST